MIPCKELALPTRKQIMATTTVSTYRLYSYDLWGNSEDGYEVNDVASTGLTYDIPDQASDDEILSIVFEGDKGSFEVNGNYCCSNTIYIDSVEEGAPAYELRKE